MVIRSSSLLSSVASLCLLSPIGAGKKAQFPFFPSFISPYRLAQRGKETAEGREEELYFQDSNLQVNPTVVVCLCFFPLFSLLCFCARLRQEKIAHLQPSLQVTLGLILFSGLLLFCLSLLSSSSSFHPLSFFSPREKRGRLEVFLIGSVPAQSGERTRRCYEEEPS